MLLKGKDYHHRFTKEDNQKALDVLEKAIQADEHNCKHMLGKHVF